MPNYTEENIQAIFGHEAAEDEAPERLQQYYFKNQTYEKVRANLPLRILVGHKGIGKSALFTVAKHEDDSQRMLSLSLRPDDISEIDTSDLDFNKQIQQWKSGLSRIIQARLLEGIGASKIGPGKAGPTTGKLLKVMKDIAQPYLKDKVDLDAGMKLAAELLLRSKAITIYLDDLDRGWQGRQEDIRRISTLLNAVRDMCNSDNEIRFRIALRSDVYFAVRTSDESTDKIEGSVIWYSWTNNEILALLVKRIETFFGREVSERDLLRRRSAELAKYLDSVMTPRFMGSGKWTNTPTYRILMSLIRKRPRDLVKLCTSAARQSYSDKREMIITDDLKSIFEDYSQQRVQDTINEHKSELPEIERLLINMKPNQRKRVAAQGYLFTTDLLLQKVSNIMSQGKFRFSNGREASSRDLAGFMYKINFLTARKERADGYVDRKYFEENRYLSSTLTDFGYDWEIHPAYRWALQPHDLESLYHDIALSADD